MAREAAGAAKKARARTTMSDAHKVARAEGREQGRSVRHYLEALEQHRPKCGRKRTKDRSNVVSRRFGRTSPQPRRWIGCT